MSICILITRAGSNYSRGRFLAQSLYTLFLVPSLARCEYRLCSFLGLAWQAPSDPSLRLGLGRRARVTRGALKSVVAEYPGRQHSQPGPVGLGPSGGLHTHYRFVMLIITLVAGNPRPRGAGSCGLGVLLRQMSPGITLQRQRCRRRRLRRSTRSRRWRGSR